jgi:predicted ribosome quality control (RQC) complex YloA/Tae2 family protein
VKGELLMANLHQVEPGQKRIMAQNYYDSDLKTISIDLDPQVSPSQNAQRYFRKYNKAKRGKSVINQLIADNEAEIEVLDHYCFGLESSQTLDDFLSLRSEFEKKGWVSDKSKRKNDNQTVGTFRKYISPDGFQIYVGRNSVENDLLLRRVAKSQDMWLHARQIHGSHVIIRNPEKKPGIPMPTLLQAAQLAAVFSKAKHSNHVPVDYTWAKHVVKRRGIGFVHYTHQKTLNVEPKIQQTEAKSVDMYDVESH